MQIPKFIKRILKPIARIVASITVSVLLFVNYYLFHNRKDKIPVLFINLCMNDHLVFKIDPMRIKHHVNDPDAMPDNLFVWSGDWDTRIFDIERHEKFDLIKQLIIDKKEYKDTKFYAYAMEELNSGNPISRGEIVLDSEEKIFEYFRKQKQLFKNIKTRGFDLDLAPEIGIAVGRDGSLIHYRQGHHSLAMAKIFKVALVSARIRSVHDLWLLKHIKSEGFSLLEKLKKGLEKLYV